MSAADPAAEPRARRADAEHSIAAILDAAVVLLGDRPEASMSEIAAAAGVVRQTVYGHFGSREALLAAVAGRALDRALVAMDQARPGEGEPAEALDRLVAAWWQAVAPHARVLDALGAAHPDAQAVRDLHAPILQRLHDLIRRGQRAGSFDRDLPVQWAAVAFLGLMHATADEVAAGRIDAKAGGRSLSRTVPRLFGVDRTS